RPAEAGSSSGSGRRRRRPVRGATVDERSARLDVGWNLTEDGGVDEIAGGRAAALRCRRQTIRTPVRRLTRPALSGPRGNVAGPHRLGPAPDRPDAPGAVRALIPLLDVAPARGSLGGGR